MKDCEVIEPIRYVAPFTSPESSEDISRSDFHHLLISKH